MQFVSQQMELPFFVRSFGCALRIKITCYNAFFGRKYRKMNLLKFLSHKKKPSANETTCSNAKDTSSYTKGLNFALNKDRESYEVIGIGTAYTNYEIIIPCEYKGKPVTSIGSEAFKALESISGVTIPYSVTSIGASAFYGCTGLTSITLGHNVEGIGDEAFAYCTGLTSITIPNSVTSIGASAFYCCEKLTDITLSGDNALDIGVSAFSGTMYYNDGSNWKGGVLYVSKYLVDAKRTISGTYTVKDGTLSIAYSAFCNCDSLTSVTIPDSVKLIGDSVFSGCSSLESITLPFVGNTLRYGKFGFIFGTSSYKGATAIEYEFPDVDLRLRDGGGVKITYYTKTYYIPTRLKSVTVTGGEIEDFEFDGCTGLTSVTIGNSVTGIGKNAFKDCNRLTSVTIGNSVKSIGGRAFGHCTVLKRINYRGTQAQWTAISKGTSWDYGTGNYTITYNYTGE